MKIDYLLYPKHDWIEDLSCEDLGFITLICKDCDYMVRERLVGNTYIAYQFNYSKIDRLELYTVNYNNDPSDIGLIRKNLLSCNEVMIKNALE